MHVSSREADEHIAGVSRGTPSRHNVDELLGDVLLAPLIERRPRDPDSRQHTDRYAERPFEVPRERGGLARGNSPSGTKATGRGAARSCVASETDPAAVAPEMSATAITAAKATVKWKKLVGLEPVSVRMRPKGS